MRNIIKDLNSFIKYVSPSYLYYNIIKVDKKYESSEEKNVRKTISEIMKYFFYFIDFIVIFVILSKNTISLYRKNDSIDAIIYFFITLIVFIFIYKFLIEINRLVKDNDIIEEIIKFKEYDKKEEYIFIKYTEIEKSMFENQGTTNRILEIKQYNKNKEFGSTFKNYIKKKVVQISLGKIFYIGLIILLIGIFVLICEKYRKIISLIVIYYFFMRPFHYCIVFYEDFKNKVNKDWVDSTSQKIRYINMALLNYIKVTLEFSILIYIFKFIGLAFIDVKANTFLEIIYILVSGSLEVKTTIEILTYIIMKITMAVVVVLNLAIYMSLEVKK